MSHQVQVGIGDVWRLYGDPEAEIVACGHSHARSLLQALEAGDGPFGLTAAVAFTEDREPPTAEDYWDYVAELVIGRTVAIVWNGNQHNSAFLLRQQPPFRVYDPEGTEPGAEEGAWLPRGLFRELWLPTMDGLSVLLDRIGAICSPVVVCTPPPKPDSLVRSALATEPLFLEQSAELGYDAGDPQIAPEAVRVALWRLLRDLLAETAAAAGAPFVPVPPEAVTPDGLLRAEYSDPDVTHANSAYGRLVWSQLADLVRSRGAA
jgi:hypothetical protein